MAGAFRVYSHPVDAEHPDDIAFELQPNATGPIPDDQTKLKIDVERALTVLRGIYKPDNPKFSYYQKRLLSLAQMGLVGDTANPSLAQSTLATLLTEFAEQEGAYVKHKHINSLNRATIFLSVPFLVLALGGMLIAPFAGPKIADLYSSLGLDHAETASSTTAGFLYFGNFCLVWSSCIVGIWLSSVQKAASVEFSRLHNIEEWQLNPWIRSIFIGLLSIILAILVYRQFIVLTIGGISFSSFYKDPFTSVLFGVLCGIGERALSSKVSKQAEVFLTGK